MGGGAEAGREVDASMDEGAAVGSVTDFGGCDARFQWTTVESADRTCGG